MKLIIFAGSISLLVMLSSCGSKTSGTTTSGGTATGNSNSLTGQELIAISNATAEQCVAGGKVYSIYIDLNANGLQDPSEASLSSQIVCNGVNGSVGYSSLFSINRVAVAANICAAETGLQLSTGLDTNRSLTLDTSEILQTEILCDGKNGAVGAAGPAGANGHNMVFQVAPASLDECSAGGSTILMALDVQNSGIYSALDPEQQSLTVCNGMSGQNGNNGSDGKDGKDGVDAPVPAYSPVATILPCGNTVAFKEVLLRLNNGQVLAAFSENPSGLNTRLSLLPDGTFVDTDSSNCTFSLSTSADGATRSISWSGQVQESWPVVN